MTSAPDRIAESAIFIAFSSEPPWFMPISAIISGKKSLPTFLFPILNILLFNLSFFSNYHSGSAG